MRLRLYYWGLIIIWHTLLLVAAYFLLHETYYWFILAQLGLLLSLVFAYRVYRHFRRPLDLINGGKSAMQDRDFSIKYRLTGAREVDALRVDAAARGDASGLAGALAFLRAVGLDRIARSAALELLLLERRG